MRGHPSASNRPDAPEPVIEYPEGESGPLEIPIKAIVYERGIKPEHEHGATAWWESNAELQESRIRQALERINQVPRFLHTFAGRDRFLRDLNDLIARVGLPQVKPQP